MYYSVFHISILIDLLLAKAEQQRNRSGFLKVLELVNDNAPIPQDKIDDQFLYKLNSRISKCIGEKNKTIRIKSTSYIDNCLSYLGYYDFKELVEDIEDVRGLIGLLLKANSELTFVIPNSKKNNLISRINSFNTSLQLKVYNDESTNWEKEIESKEKEAIILFISPKLLDQQAKLIDLFNQKQPKFILPYWLTDEYSALRPYGEIATISTKLYGNQDQHALSLLLVIILKEHTNAKPKKKKENKIQGITNIIKADNNGFIIGELKSKQAPQINNNYYSSNYDKD